MPAGRRAISIPYSLLSNWYGDKWREFESGPFARIITHRCWGDSNCCLLISWDRPASLRSAAAPRLLLALFGNWQLGVRRMLSAGRLQRGVRFGHRRQRQCRARHERPLWRRKMDELDTVQYERQPGKLRSLARYCADADRIASWPDWSMRPRAISASTLPWTTGVATFPRACDRSR